jgi:chromosome segregation ATPase
MKISALEERLRAFEQGEMGTSNADASSLERERGERERERGEYQAMIERLEAGKAASEERVKTLEGEKHDSALQAASLRDKLSNLEAKLESTDDTIKELRSENSDLRGEVSKLKSARTDEREKEALSAAVVNARGEIRELEEKVASLEGALSEAARDSVALGDKHAMVEAELRSEVEALERKLGGGRGRGIEVVERALEASERGEREARKRCEELQIRMENLQSEHAALQQRWEASDRSRRAREDSSDAHYQVRSQFSWVFAKPCICSDHKPINLTQLEKDHAQLLVRHAVLHDKCASLEAQVKDNPKP